MKYIRKVLALLRKADETFSLLGPKDSVLVGVSGGKDSLALLYALSIYRKFAQKDFRIVPVTLDLGFPNFDATEITKFAESLGLSLKVEDSKEIYPILQAHTKEGHHLPCSICSRMKKAAINAAAKKYRCNKVAFAHHQDDALETLLMNMIHGGKIATFEPEMRLSRACITFIRPFIFVGEDDIKGLVKEENLPVMGKICVADGFTEREYCKQKLATLYQQRSDARTNFGSMLYNYEPFVLYFDRIYYAVDMKKSYSLKPAITANNVIAYNALCAKHDELSPIKNEGTHFFFCHKKKIVGRIEINEESHHLYLITACESILGKEETAFFLRAFMEFLGKKVNPIYFVYKAKDKSLSKKLGYQKGLAPAHSNDLAYYLKK